MNEPILTSLEIERAVDALIGERAIRRELWDADQLNRLFGRSTRSLRSTLFQLSALGLLAINRDGRWGLTATGAEVLDARSGGDWQPLARLVLRAGDMEHEVFALLMEAQPSDHRAVLLQGRARKIVPALATVIDWVPAWRDGKYFAIPLEALQMAMAGAAMEIADGRPEWVSDRERVGHRAEAYSLRLEREQRGAGAILHVSREEGDRYGYDLEDVSAQPPRWIECKGSRGGALSFVMSANELAVAKRHPDRYEIHYWAHINLGRPPEEDYSALRKLGYPMVIKDPASMLDRGDLVAECTAWKVKSSAPASSSPQDLT